MSQFPLGPTGTKLAGLSRRRFLGMTLAAAAVPTNVTAQDAAPAENGVPEAAAVASTPAPRHIPARDLPVPKTVSPELQAVIGAPYPPGWNDIPGDTSAWKQLALKSEAAAAGDIAAIRERFGLKVEKTSMAGVPVFVITPRKSRRKIKIVCSSTCTAAAMSCSPAKQVQAKA